MSELSIVQRVGQGSHEAMEECVKRYHGLVHAIVRRYFAHRYVDDVMQDIWLSIWKSASKYNQDNHKNEANYIALVAGRRCIDEIAYQNAGNRKSEGHRVPLSGNDRYTKQSHIEAIEQKDELHHVLRHADNLPDKHRHILNIGIRCRSVRNFANSSGTSYQTAFRAIHIAKNEVSRSISSRNTVNNIESRIVPITGRYERYDNTRVVHYDGSDDSIYIIEQLLCVYDGVTLRRTTKANVLYILQSGISDIKHCAIPVYVGDWVIDYGDDWDVAKHASILNECLPLSDNPDVEGVWCEDCSCRPANIKVTIVELERKIEKRLCWDCNRKRYYPNKNRKKGASHEKAKEKPEMESK